MKKSEATYQQLIEASIQLFAQHGIEKTSLAMIAKQVGISKPSIYYYFASKDELVEKIFQYLFQDYYFDYYFQLEQFDRSNFAELLFEGGLRMLPEEHNEEHRLIMRLLNEFVLTAGRDQSYADRINAMQQQFLDGFERLLARGAELGLVSPDNLREKAHTLALVIDNLSSYMMLGIPLSSVPIWKYAIDSVLISGGDKK